ncbi:MAG: hypothetical protein JSW07_16325 [bacterium]|nr:MAG: hypothetical protein JSW07_16325 [bacterium]
MGESVIKCKKCKKLIWKSSIYCVWCYSINKSRDDYKRIKKKPMSPIAKAIAKTFKDKDFRRNTIEEDFWKYMWEQLDSELLERYNLDPKKWNWLGNSQEGHYCPIARIENNSGTLMNPKSCHCYAAWFDWDCKETCKKLIPEDFNTYDENVYNYYQPEPGKCGVVFFWDLLEPEKGEDNKCKHDFKNLPQKKEFGKPEWIKK